MSRISETLLEITEMLQSGVPPATVAATLGVPYDWVSSTYTMMLYGEPPLDDEYEV